jgi:thiamine biosynthesis lipoprotein
MKLPQSVIYGFLLLILCSSATVPPAKTANLYVSDYENVLGTSLELKVAALSPDQASAAENAAMTEIDRMNKILSGYDASSEFSRWLHADKKPTKISPELFEVLGLFDKWRAQSGGALDASAEVIGQVWKSAAKRNRQPSAAELAAAVATVKKAHWKLNEADQTALRLDDAPLMLNSFAKSYIINKACNVALASGGITAVVMNIGGDIVVRGNHTEQIQVSNPKADAENDPPISSLLISNKAVATSGNYRRGELVNGRWHSHIVDPRTGLPADNVISATVVADNATDAGALATALNVLTPEESKNLAATIPHAEFMLITSDGKRIESDGWKSLEIPAIKPETPKTVKTLAGDKTWDPDYQLLINLELSQIEGMRVHRPYVAVWVVDKDKKPVRSIALWYKKPKYLDEMRAWYDTYYSRFLEDDRSISSTTSATRPAGKYTLKWDGKNDKGELVKRGVYTIMIEVAREHGTYQLITKEMDFTKSLKPITLPGNVEVASASLDYVKKADGQ